MPVGYARVSTEDQTIDLQKDALRRARCRETYEEYATGKNTARPQLEACLKSLREGDTFVVWRLDRLGRNLAGTAQNRRHPGCRNSRPFWSRPVYPVPRRPQLCGLTLQG
jgi:Resolvase, N terminal domain